jgi:hypothetical protein
MPLQICVSLVDVITPSFKVYTRHYMGISSHIDVHKVGSTRFNNLETDRRRIHKSLSCSSRSVSLPLLASSEPFIFCLDPYPLFSESIASLMHECFIFWICSFLYSLNLELHFIWICRIIEPGVALLWYWTWSCVVVKYDVANILYLFSVLHFKYYILPLIGNNCRRYSTNFVLS